MRQPRTRIRYSNGVLLQTAGKKKPEPVKPTPGRTPDAGAAAVAPRRRARSRRRRRTGRRGGTSEPAGGDITVTGASLVEWSPAQSAFEVAQANPGLCAVLENAALLYAGGQAQPARALLEAGRAERPRRQAVAACLARAVRPAAAGGRPRGVRPARAAIRRAVRALGAGVGERGDDSRARGARVGGYVAVTGKLTAAIGDADRGLQARDRRQVARRALDLASVTGFDDAGARLLADALADARRAALRTAAAAREQAAALRSTRR